MILHSLTGPLRWLAEFGLLLFAGTFARKAAREWEWRKMLDGDARLKAAENFGGYLAMSLVLFLTYFLEGYK